MYYFLTDLQFRTLEWVTQNPYLLPCRELHHVVCQHRAHMHLILPRKGHMVDADGLGLQLAVEKAAAAKLGKKQGVDEGRPQGEALHPRKIFLGIIHVRRKQDVLFTTPKKTTVTVEDENETILLKDDTGKNKILMDLKSGEISIIASKKLTLKAGQTSLELDGTSNSVKVNGGNVNVAAKQNLDLQGQVSAKIKGGTLSAQGDQMAELKSTGPVTVKGAIVKVN